MEQNNNTIELTVSEGQTGMRLDKCLSELLRDHSRVYLQKLIKNGKVTLDGKVCKVPRTSVQSGMRIEVLIPEEKKMELSGEDIDLPILFEDDDIIVINKPAGIVVHPAAGNWTGTVVNALLGRDENFSEGFSDEDSEFRPGIVHRLDKDTSGCLVVAKNESAHFKLAKSFSERKVSKVYAALTYGWPHCMEEKITTYISRHPTQRKKMAVNDRHGKLAISVYNVVKKGKIETFPVTLSEVQIFTGRTHQIRVHMAHKKAPVLGDTLYGGNQRLEAPRQMLHAWKLSFTHPTTGEDMHFESPFPEDFQAFLDRIIED